MMGTAAPGIRFIPAIIRFPGCNPLPEARTMAEQFVRHRTTLGMSQNEAALKIGVDAGTLARWERGEREPTGEFLGRVKRLLGGEDARNERVCRVG
jgi:predicted transcriptional regulator